MSLWRWGAEGQALLINWDSVSYVDSFFTSLERNGAVKQWTQPAVLTKSMRTPQLIERYLHAVNTCLKFPSFTALENAGFDGIFNHKTVVLVGSPIYFDPLCHKAEDMETQEETFCILWSLNSLPSVLELKIHECLDLISLESLLYIRSLFKSSNF